MISTIITAYVSNEQDELFSFTPVKTDIAIIAEENTPLVEGLKKELEKVANFVDLPDRLEALQDALYFREVTSIIRIPKGFTESFMNGESIQVEKTTVPDSYTDIYVDMCIDQYLNTARLYVNHVEGISQELLTEYVAKDLSVSTPVIIEKSETKDINTNFSVYYFNFLAYSLLSILILGIGSIMVVFNNPDIRMRNYSSPISITSFNMQMVSALSLFTFASWLVLVIFSFLLNWKNSLNIGSVYFLINSLVFAFAGAGISFFIGNMLKSMDAISAAGNIVTLGSSFVSGVMVPQQFLGNGVLRIASFTPTYWYVKANNQIGGLTHFDMNSLWPSIFCMLVQAGFGILFFALAIAASRRKRRI